MEVRLNIDDAFIKTLQEKVGRTVSAYDLTRDALTLFNWAVHEVAAGRVIVSTNATGEDLQRPVMPTLMHVEAKAKQLSAAQAAVTPADEQSTV
jgi:hypothetical protein